MIDIINFSEVTIKQACKYYNNYYVLPRYSIEM